MTFIVTLMGLLIERFFDWGHIRHWSWFKKYQAYIANCFVSLRPYVVFALIILPIVLGALLFNYLISNLLYGFLELAFQLVLLIYCFGPRNLWADGFQCINMLSLGSKEESAAKLKDAFDIDEEKYNQSLNKHLLDTIFIEANRRIFAVIFWYIIAGPMGALLYRLVSISATSNIAVILTPARTINDLLNWLPVRLLTFLFALGGHFVKVISCWRHQTFITLDRNEIVLTECGNAALGSENVEVLPQDGTLARQAISLLDRVFTISLVIIALSVLLG